MPRNTAHRWWAVFGVYAAAVLIVGVIPVPQVGPKIPSLDKVEHLLEYLLFSWLLVHAQLSSGRAWARAASAACLAAALYGGLIELIQAFLPYRNAEWLDVAANSLGGLAGVYCVGCRMKSVSHG